MKRSHIYCLPARKSTIVIMPETIRSKRVIFMDRNRCVYRKLKSVKGATLMVALLFFLVCACVGSVILAAANTTAGRASSIKDEGNRERYAVNDAVDLVKTEMNKMNAVSATQTWKLSYTQDDFKLSSDGTSVEAADPVLKSGKWVMDLDDNLDQCKWSYVITEKKVIVNNDGSTKVDNCADWSLKDSYFSFDQKNHSMKQSGASTLSNLYQIRDSMAYAVCRHYWSQIAAAVSTENTDGTDPWASLTMGEVPWDQIVTASDTTSNNFSITTSTPFEISLSEEKSGIPTVYAEMSMDSNFNFKVELYCKDGNVKVDDRWLVFKPADVSVNRASDETEQQPTGAETSDQTNPQTTIKLSDGTEIENQTSTYSVTRTVTWSARWDDGTVKLTGGTE